MSFPDYWVKDGMILHHGRLLVPNNATLCTQLLIEFHSTDIGGQSGITRTYQRLAANFYWKNMKVDVQQFVANCHIFQQTKPSFLSPGGLLQPLPIPQAVFEDIAMDFITYLPLSRAKIVIMVVVDRLSKYGYFVVLPSSFSSVSVATVFINEIVRLHGVPLSIVTDLPVRLPWPTTSWLDCQYIMLGPQPPG